MITIPIINYKTKLIFKLFFIYTFLILIYNYIFSSVYLGDIESLLKLAKNNDINEWQMLGGYLTGKFALLFNEPKIGLFIINVLFWIMSITLFHLILKEYIKSNLFIFLITLFSPLFIFSNIIYKESFPIFFFLLAFTKFGWISPIFNSILRINLFIESLLIYIALNYKTHKKVIVISILLSLSMFFYQLSLYDKKNGVMNTVIDSYLVGINLQKEILTSSEITKHYDECREFEQLYVKNLIPQHKVDETNKLFLKLFNEIKTSPKELALHLVKKTECVFLNYNRFFLLPSATYRIGSEIRDYFMIALTQLNPLFRPIFGLIFLLIPGTFSLLTRFVLIAGFFVTIFMHTNPEARYFFPFILAGIINVSAHINRYINRKS